jgi:hypothetical protein
LRHRRNASALLQLAVNRIFSAPRDRIALHFFPTVFFLPTFLSLSLQLPLISISSSFAFFFFPCFSSPPALLLPLPSLLLPPFCCCCRRVPPRDRRDDLSTKHCVKTVASQRRSCFGNTKQLLSISNRNLCLQFGRMRNPRCFLLPFFFLPLPLPVT